MKFVAVLRTPSQADDAARALASASGLALAEARMRLASEPSCLVARLAQDRADALVVTLRRAGLAALAVDTAFPTDKDRTVAHSFIFEDAAITFVPRFGDSIRVLWPDVLAVLRGLRATRSEVERVGKSKTFSVSATVVTGGLKMTRTSTKTMRSSDESAEQVILVYTRDGRAALLAEHELEFSRLGSRPGRRARGNSSTASCPGRLRPAALASSHPPSTPSTRPISSETSWAATTWTSRAGRLRRSRRSPRWKA